MLDLWHAVLAALPDGLREQFEGQEAAILIVFCAVAIICLHLLRICRIRLFGRKYKALKTLNRNFYFDDGLKARYEYTVRLNSRQQLERYDFKSFFSSEYGRDTHNMNAILASASKNERLYKKYRAEVAKLLSISLDDENQRKVKFFDPLELKLCKRKILKVVVSPVFHCTAEYISPKGKNRVTRSGELSVKEMEVVVRQYQKNLEHKNSKAYQRSLMTSSLRYDVMKRDNFRCQICGRSAQDGVKLHVDHILPVSKGGLTVKENLRTLCDKCNLGKSDKYDPNGPN